MSGFSFGFLKLTSSTFSGLPDSNSKFSQSFEGVRISLTNRARTAGSFSRLFPSLETAGLDPRRHGGVEPRRAGGIGVHVRR